MNRLDGEIGRSFKDRNMGDDGVVGLEVDSNIKSGRSGSHDLCKKKNICKTFVSEKINHILV